MAGSERRIDEVRDFFRAQDRGKVKRSSGIGSLGNAPGLLESLDVEKTQARQVVGNGERNPRRRGCIAQAPTLSTTSRVASAARAALF
jgi:hypothetical protein